PERPRKEGWRRCNGSCGGTRRRTERTPTKCSWSLPLCRAQRGAHGDQGISAGGSDKVDGGWWMVDGESQKTRPSPLPVSTNHPPPSSLHRPPCPLRTLSVRRWLAHNTSSFKRPGGPSRG